METRIFVSVISATTTRYSISVPSTDEQYVQQVERAGDDLEAAIAAAVVLLLATNNEPDEEQFVKAIQGIVLTYLTGQLALLLAFSEALDPPNIELLAADVTRRAAKQLHEATRQYGPQQLATPQAEKLKLVAASVVTTLTNSFNESIASLLGFDSKRWYTRLDRKVRPSHRMLEGDVVPLQDSFQLPSGMSIRFPGDPAAPLTETAGCRCRVGYVEDSE